MANFKGLYSTLSDDVLAELSKDGIDNAFNELAMRYLGIISYIARKYSVQGWEQKDFMQEGLLGLMYACKTYDKSSGTSFKSYLSLIVERRFISILRRSQTLKTVPDSALVQIDSLEDDLLDYEKSPEEQLLYKERLSHVLKRLNALLSAREYEVLMLFASGLSYSKISHKLHISEKSVDNALQRVRRKVGSFDMS